MGGVLVPARVDEVRVHQGLHVGAEREVYLVCVEAARHRTGLVAGCAVRRGEGDVLTGVGVLEGGQHRLIGGLEHRETYDVELVLAAGGSAGSCASGQGGGHGEGRGGQGQKPDPSGHGSLFLFVLGDQRKLRCLVEISRRSAATQTPRLDVSQCRWSAAGRAGRPPPGTAASVRSTPSRGLSWWG